MLRTLPFLALVPLFILWFGIGETPKIALVALGTTFPIYLTLFAGIRGVDAKLVEAGNTLGLSRREQVRHIVLPGALPSALVGLRYALGVAWLSLVVAEQINAESGIGLPRHDRARLPAHRHHPRRPHRLCHPRPQRRSDRPCPRAPGARLATQLPEGLIHERSSCSRQPIQPPVVQVSNLVRSFGKGPNVLDGLDLTIRAGEFVALLGRSGSGKSTLLRTLAGLDAAPAGTVTVPAERAVVFQEPRLIPWKTVWANVALGLRTADAQEQAVAALTEVGLGHRLEAWPLTLSGGEAQRAALARALVREPKLLLLDEPFAALDALTRLKTQKLVASLWRAHRPAVLLVTHDVDEALLLADRVLVLDQGRIALRPAHRSGAAAPPCRPRLCRPALAAAERAWCGRRRSRLPHGSVLTRFAPLRQGEDISGHPDATARFHRDRRPACGVLTIPNRRQP